MDKSIRMQIAAERIHSLAEDVDGMMKQLDMLQAEIGEELYERVVEAMPEAYTLSAKKLHALVRELEPVE